MKPRLNALKPVNETRLRVKHKDGRFGHVEKVLTGTYCTVQFDRCEYYENCRIDDLEPRD